MAQTILGLDVGAHAVKAVLLESTFRSWRVVGHAAEPVTPAEAGGPALRVRQAAALTRLLAAQGWRVDACTAVAPGAAVAAHVITLPFTDPRRIEQTVGFEVEAQIPQELAEVAWDWQLLAPRPGVADLWVGVTPKADLTAFLATLSEAGLDPRAVLPGAPTLAALLGAGLTPDAEAPAADAGAAPTGPPVEGVLDLGHERSHLCLAAGGLLEAARTVPLGAAAVARSLARDLGLAEADAARLLAAEAGGAPLEEPLASLAAEPQAAEALRRALAPLVRELRATLRAWRARAGQRPLTRLWLAGGLGRLPGLPELLAPELDGPVAPLELGGEAVAGLPAEAVPGLALALSAALRGHQGGRGSRLNLRRGDTAYTRDFEHLKGKVTTLAVYAGLVLLLAVATTGVKIFALARHEQLLDRVLCDAEERVMKKCFPNHEEAISALKGRGVPGAAIPKLSAVDVLGELSQRTPEGVSLRYDRIDITDKKLHLQGTTDAAEHVDRIVASLKGSRCFGDARSGGARKRAAEAKFEFSVDSALTCGGPVQGGE